MSKLQSGANNQFGNLINRWGSNISADNMKIAGAGLVSITLAVSAGLAIAGWMAPVETQPARTEAFRTDNSQPQPQPQPRPQVLKPAASEPVKVASLDGQTAISGGYQPERFEQFAQAAETIVPRQSGSELNPYAIRKPTAGPAPANTQTTQTQTAPAVPPPLPAAPPQQGDEGLRALTDEVVSKLEQLKKSEGDNNPDALTPATDDLRKAIQVLVIKATSKGKSSAYIQALIDKALDGRDAVPVALAKSDGKLDTRLLLASVLPKKVAKNVGNTDGGYLAALESESRAISETGKKSKKSSRKRRYIIVRKGDNLSEIAMRVYGDPLAFVKIYRANRKVLVNANMLSIGQRLVIPR